MEQLEFIRNAGETRRFHTVPVLRQQTVAEHSFHVTMLVWVIFGGDMPGVRMELILASLCHDLAEHIVGDIPAPAKRNMGEQFPDFRAKWGEMEENILQPQGLDWDKFLTDEERDILKFCDALEGMLYCLREYEMGNRLIVGCFNNFGSYVFEILKKKLPDDQVPFEESPVKNWLLAKRQFEDICMRWRGVR